MKTSQGRRRKCISVAGADRDAYARSEAGRGVRTLSASVARLDECG